MNETVTKRFLLYFRLMMVVWILIANAFFHAIEFEYSWLVFLSNIMLFTMEGDIKDRFISVELGGLVGMVLTVLAMLAIGALTPVLGGMLGLLLPLGVVLFILIILHPYAPKVLNNVGFAYLTVACIDSAAFAANLPLFFGVYIVGSLVFNGGCVLLMKPARYLAARSIRTTSRLTPESELLVFSSFFSQRPGIFAAGALHFYVDSAVFPCYNGVN